jgi:hypothetical protein
MHLVPAASASEPRHSSLHPLPGRNNPAGLAMATARIHQIWTVATCV